MISAWLLQSCLTQGSLSLAQGEQLLAHTAWLALHATLSAQSTTWLVFTVDGAGATAGAKDCLDFYTQQALYNPVLRRETFSDMQKEFSYTMYLFQEG